MSIYGLEMTANQRSSGSEKAKVVVPKWSPMGETTTPAAVRR